MRGRKPIPTALKIANGNPGKRPLNMNEPTPDPAIPMCPSHLDDLAREEWDRVSYELYEIGILSNIDRAVLANYCIAWSRSIQAELKLQDGNLVLTGKDGGVYQSPWLAVANKAHEQTVKYASELGMTPSSRTRLNANPSESKNASGLMDFVSKKHG